MPLLKAEAVTLAMCAMVARGAVSDVRCAKTLTLGTCGFLNERAGELGEERLMFSTRGFLEGLDTGEDEAISCCFFFVSFSMRSSERRTMSKALRRSPV